MKRLWMGWMVSVKKILMRGKRYPVEQLRAVMYERNQQGAVVNA